MKGFLILLAFGLAASEKLDRTYLPPPGAIFSGGSPGDIQTPLELPEETTGTLVTQNGLPTLGDSLIELGINRGQPDFGQLITTKTPFTYYTENVPTTTTSYAFTQTTTLPPFETYGSTVRPITPTTGLTDQYASQNPGNFGVSSIPQNNLNVQRFRQAQHPSVSSAVINSQPGNDGQLAKYGQPSYSQLSGQYQDQYPIIVPHGGNIQTGLDSHLPNQQGFQYSDGQNVGQVFMPPQNSANFELESNNSNFGSKVSPVSPVNPPASYPDQQNQGQNLQPGFAQPSYGQNQYQQGVPPQYPRNQDSGPVSGDFKDYQPGSSSSPEYFNQPGYSSTTPLPSISSTVIPTFDSYVRPERPQAGADRNAVIISFENVRTPNGYSYSYDTSNGIHADETGIVDNGTKAKGGYSYVGDDGKVYSVTYTADENGFQPHGDHLPTPPPIPEAIQKVIDQVAREKEAGISDDGSYNEEKYGDKKYQGILNRYDSPSQYDNKQYIDGPNDNRKKPVSRITNFVSNEQNVDARPVAFDNSNNTNHNTMKPVKIPQQSSSYLVNEINQTEAPFSSAEGSSPSSSYGSAPQGSSVRVPGQKDTESEYSGSQGSYIEPGKYSGSNTNKTPEAIAYDTQDDSRNGLNKFNKPGQVTSTRLNNVSGSPQSSGKDSHRLGPAQRPSNIRFPETENAVPENVFVQKEAYNVFNDRRPSSKTSLNEGQSDSNETTPNQQTSIFVDSGYTYNRPQTKFGQNSFPTRFRGQESSMKLEGYTTTQGTTLNPFMTPNVYNKKDGSQSLFARKPFEVVLPNTENTDGDYTDDNDYPTTNQGPDTQSFSSTKVPVDKTGTTSGPDQFNQSTRPYQYTSSGQGTRITQRVTPGSKLPEYSGISKTLMPSQSRLDLNQATQKPVSRYTSRPSTTSVVSGSTINGPSTKVPSRAAFDSQYNGPSMGYSASKLAPGNSPTSNTFSPRISSANGIPPQSYSTTTYKPVDYSGSTVRPGFDLSVAPVAPTYETSYQYGSSGPPSSYNSNVATSRPVPIPSGPGMYSQVAPGSTFQYGTNDYTQSPTGPKIGSPGSNFRTGVSQVSPTATYQAEYQYGPGIPTTNGRVLPGSSTSDTVRDTPETYSSSSYRPVSNEGYTQRPINVDNFGRPINSEVTYYPGYSSTQNTALPSYSEGNRGQTPTVNQGLAVGKVPASVDSTGNTIYPGYGTEIIIGEDFSGPKQPQRFDPKTGYHY